MSLIADRAKLVIGYELGVDEDDVKLDARFIDDLGADSLDLEELRMCFEEEFSIEIPATAVSEVRTVREAVTYLERHAAG